MGAVGIKFTVFICSGLTTACARRLERRGSAADDAERRTLVAADAAPRREFAVLVRRADVRGAGRTLCDVRLAASPYGGSAAA